MELKKDPRCYTDVCVGGKWFHHDHCTSKAYMLKGGADVSVEFNNCLLYTSDAADDC